MSDGQVGLDHATTVATRAACWNVASRARVAQAVVDAVRGWNTPGWVVGDPLPDDVVERTRAKYVEAYERLTGHRFA